MSRLANQRHAKPVNLRIRDGIRTLIDRAAKIRGKTRSDFMIDAAFRAAEDTVIDQALVKVDEESFRHYLSILDKPPGGAAFVVRGIGCDRCPGRHPAQHAGPDTEAILGRLAVDSGWQAKGLGVALLQDAVLRTGQAAAILGIRGLLVHALSAEAKRFYEKYGFAASPNNPMTLIFSLKGPA
jgi:uncharacterized protein (DUF1778 family)